MSKTIQIRIALAVDPDGCWCATGSNTDDDDDWETVMRNFNDVVSGQKRYWITLEVKKPELPEPEIVKATAASA